jgi:predicted SpoU family rRNA methylase
MNNNIFTDYAMPLIKIERMAKEIHDLCLDHKYEAAREITTHLGVENRILQATLAILEEKEKAFANSKVIQAG